MTNEQALILGVVQGLTEYLPVSSSAHLVIIPHLLGWHIPSKEAFIFDVLVQLGTLLGVLAYFFMPIKEVAQSVIIGLVRRTPLHNENARLGWLVALASLPAAVIGLLFKDQVAAYFASPYAACCFLIVTGLALVACEWSTRIIKVRPSGKDAVLVGLAQGCALLPGISRSGSTIAAGMACGMSRQDAARFSFLMSIPVMFGASLLASIDLARDPALLRSLALPLGIGFLSAALSGYVVIAWFMSFVGKRRLFLFASYCLSAGLVGALYFA